MIRAVTNGNFEVLNRPERLSATLELRGEQRGFEREHEREVENNSGIQSLTRAYVRVAVPDPHEDGRRLLIISGFCLR